MRAESGRRGPRAAATSWPRSRRHARASRRSSSPGKAASTWRRCGRGFRCEGRALRLRRRTADHRGDSPARAGDRGRVNPSAPGARAQHRRGDARVQSRAGPQSGEPQGRRARQAHRERTPMHAQGGPLMPHCRCSRCGSRRTLARKPDEYVRLPRCKGAGCGARSWRLDNWRRLHEVGQGAPRPCRCHEYGFPHRRGSGACIHNADFTAEHARARWESGHSAHH